MQVYNDRPPVIVEAQADVAAANEIGSQEGKEKEASKIPQPEISIIVDGNTVTKPGMKSDFVEDDDKLVIRSEDTRQVGAYCSCNSVEICTCNTVCTCESVIARGVCSCNPVCTCQSDCSCNPYCTCNSQCTCQSQSRSGCSCAPVH